MRGWRWGAVVASAALVVVAGVATWAVVPAAQAQPTEVQAFMTLYGWADNSPPGDGIAPHTPCPQTGHTVAEGTGTYADPITFATDVAEMPYCTIIYVPYMRRYFIHEDECSQCDSDWKSDHLYRFDMWAGGDAESVHQPEKRELLHCESTWTRANSVNDPDNPEVEVDPPSDLPVTTTPIFSDATGCWAGPISLANPGKQTSIRGSAVRLQVTASDSVAGQTLSYAAANLPAGLGIDAATGLISGTAASPMRRKVTLTVSDSADSASATIVWRVVRR